MKILMVCLGNICRSPLAEGILQHKVDTLNLSWQVDSAGTYGGHAGEKPDRRSIKIALENNLDIKNQRSRQFRGHDLEEYDIIYVMDSSNKRDILAQTQNNEEREKIILIMDELYPNENIPVPDPYYGEYGFENVYKMLDEVCEVIIEKYKNI